VQAVEETDVQLAQGEVQAEQADVDDAKDPAGQTA